MNEEMTKEAKLEWAQEVEDCRAMALRLLRARVGIKETFTNLTGLIRLSEDEKRACSELEKLFGARFEKDEAKIIGRMRTAAVRLTADALFQKKKTVTPE